MNLNKNCTFSFFSENLTTTDGGSLRLDDALKSIIILEKKIDLSVSTMSLLIALKTYHI